MTGIDINRTTSGAAALLTPTVQSEIWQVAQEQSQVMRLGNRVQMGPTGTVIPIITADPVAEWVAETDEKPVHRGTFTTKTVHPYKAATIVPFSNEFARDIPGLYAAMRQRIPNALAKLFDTSVLFGPAPGTGFDTLASAPTVTVGGYDYADLLAAVAAVNAVEDADLSGWLISPQAEVGLLGTVDTVGRPLYTMSVNDSGVGSIGSLLGRPVYKSKRVFNAATTPDTVGFAGDFSQLFYGIVSGITVSASDQATINDGGTSINLWQRNMFAIRVEAEFGAVVKNANAFVRLTLDS